MRLVGLTLVLALLAGIVGGPVTASSVPTIAPHDYLAELGYSWVEGDPHTHSEHSDGQMSPERSLNAAFSQNQGDFTFLTDHGEQLSQKEQEAQKALAVALQQKGRLAGVGCEWTGTPDYLTPEGKHTKDPAFIAGPGHMLIYGASQAVGLERKKGGQAVLCPEFSLLLGWVATRAEMPLAAFAHPSLYRVEDTFDQNGDGKGFDAPAPDADLIERVFGCELSSHTFVVGAKRLETRRGCGNGTDLASSNEAGFRELLRGGWRVSPLMSTDNHLLAYKAGPYTAVAVRERSIEGILDGFFERLTCATERRGATIALTGWQRYYPNGGAHMAPPELKLMGQAMRINPEADKLFFDVSIRDSKGKVPGIKQCGLVAVWAQVEDDVDFLVLERARHKEDPKGHPITVMKGGNYSYLISPFRGRQTHIAADQGLRAVYAKAILRDGSELVSAPISFGY